MLALLFSLNCMAQIYETTVQDVVFNSSSRLILTEAMIQKSQAPNVPSLLLTAANISVTSTPFQPTSISIRGGDSGHVLIFVDGIPFYDPSTIQRTGNLAALDIKSIKRIEIIKGSQSVLYGGQALGGVIKIETLPQNDFSEINGEIGSHNHLAFGAEIAKKNFIARGNLKERKADSPAKDSKKTYTQDQNNISLAYRWKNSTEGYIKAHHLYVNSFSPSSDASYQIVDMDNFNLSSEQNFLTSQVQFKETKWNPKLSMGLQNGVRFFVSPNESMDEDYKSHFRFIRLDLKPYNSDTLIIDAGINYSYEDFRFEEFDIKKAEAFLEQRGLFTKFTTLINQDNEMSYGARLEDWSGHNPVSVIQVGFSHKKTKVEASTGYKAPTLYQSHSTYGNPDLKEEQGTQYSLSQEFKNLSVTVFYSRFKNLISTTGTFPAIRYVNINDTETKGAELSYQIDSIILNLSYQEPKDLDKNNWLPRRPLVNGSLQYLFGNEQKFGSFEILAVGPRKDVGPNGNVRIPSYVVGNFGYNFVLSPTSKIYSRVNNLTSSRYEETYAYFAEGISGILGWSGSF